MKRETARLLRGVLRLIEADVREIADSVVEIDEREAAHYGHLESRVRLLEDVARDTRDDVYDLQRRTSSLDNLRPDGSHSRRV